ncbi:aminoglycoside 6-adenylyltransferase [Alkalihalobacillus sp. 1P02AB]|uniref:aminoglycoside 6-adenylyltransferase n=1 Tax=Alkalihalobacillus sp. 1P02AB TaxID=3132260 RepID=UPI0039A6076A
MRTEQEIMDSIIRTAQEAKRIRAVYLNGSRTNPNAPKDIFQDYDIVYVVTETASFIQNREWLQPFGEFIMMQEPDNNFSNDEEDFESSYGFLVLFTDGNRIDLRLQTKETLLENYKKDKLTLPLLDKDHTLPAIPPPSDIDYHVQRPFENDFNCYTNNFEWCLQNVAKGIWRDELPYAKLMFEYTVKKSLDKVVSWWIGIEQNFQVSSGKMGKYFKTYLPKSA